MIKDAERNLMNARYAISKAEEYFENINRLFIIEWLRLDKYPKEKTLNQDEKFREHVTDIFNIILKPHRYVDDLNIKDEARRNEIETFESNIGTASMILSILNHRDRLRYFMEAIRKDLFTVNSEWLKKIGNRYTPFGHDRINWNIFKNK